MKTYIVVKGCHLGAAKTQIKLNERQAAHLLAAGLIVEQTTHKTAQKTTQTKGAKS